MPAATRGLRGARHRSSPGTQGCTCTAQGPPRSDCVKPGPPRSDCVRQGLPRSDCVRQGLLRSDHVGQDLPRSDHAGHGMPRSDPTKPYRPYHIAKWQPSNVVIKNGQGIPICIHGRDIGSFIHLLRKHVDTKLIPAFMEITSVPHRHHASNDGCCSSNKCAP
eukprot:354255-Chlamydomonas_euryale.AAC.8